MTPKPGPKLDATPQLGLPFVQQGPAHDLTYYIGICTVFAGYHKRWPTAQATREEFRAARIPGYDGRRLAREVRFPGPALAQDPSYQALQERCRAEGIDDGVGLAMLDPRHRSVLQDKDIAELFESLALAGDAEAGCVRYATGTALHAPDELTLHCGEAIRMRAVEAARLDALDPRVLRQMFSIRVHANDALKQFIDRVGLAYRSSDGLLADHYCLEASDDGRLSIRYQMVEGSRYAGRFDVARQTARLAAMLAARPDLARADGRKDAARERNAAVAAPRVGCDEELLRQLRTLTLDGSSLMLPIQALSRLSDIMLSVQEAGGVYRPRQQRFDFPDNTAAADVLGHLLARYEGA
ncbi:hypothetical protein LE190_06145 [Massilia oculi]|uniref:Uncharacterized protein n=1 Tax=Massilia hydrophila TaxID=3044279 RepID=A0ABS7Y8U4_9BURK|nr:hypothetical protein [Massilia oculi]MCA1855507.1 hypothetical protein [Massilia oculi]